MCRESNPGLPSLLKGASFMVVVILFLQNTAHVAYRQ